MTPARRIPIFLASLVAMALLAYCLLLGALAVFQDRVIYPAPAGGAPPALTGWQRIGLETKAGRLVAYQLPARAGMPTVVFLHGNASGYRDSVLATAGMAARGMGVLVVEYPGYAGNPGRPTEASLRMAADAGMDRLMADGVSPGRIAVYGNSVGTGAAIHAAMRPHGMLILVSPLASMTDLVRGRVPGTPAFLLRDRHENAATIARVKGPVLIVHARDDQVIPFEQGERMAAAARVALTALPAGDHQIAFDRTVSDRVADHILENIPPL